jgi:hypothetical protein
MHTAPSEPWGSNFAPGGLEVDRNPNLYGVLSDGQQLFFIRRSGGTLAILDGRPKKATRKRQES